MTTLTKEQYSKMGKRGGTAFRHTWTDEERELVRSMYYEFMMVLDWVITDPDVYKEMERRFWESINNPETTTTEGGKDAE